LTGKETEIGNHTASIIIIIIIINISVCPIFSAEQYIKRYDRVCTLSDARNAGGSMCQYL
jgi:hypothetical protein